VENIPRRGSRKGKIIALCVLGAATLGVAAALIVNRSVIGFMLSPDKITLKPRGETEAILERLAAEGSVKLAPSLPSEPGTVRFTDAKDSVAITATYAGERMERVAGVIDTSKVGIDTIEEAKAFARVMLSPVMGGDETAALLLRYAPGIIANVGGDTVNYTFDIGKSYTVRVEGSPYSVVEFSIAVNPGGP
jgi:hypothetical protein